MRGLLRLSIGMSRDSRNGARLKWIWRSPRILSGSGASRKRRYSGPCRSVSPIFIAIRKARQPGFALPPLTVTFASKSRIEARAYRQKNNLRWPQRALPGLESGACEKDSGNWAATSTSIRTARVRSSWRGCRWQLLLRLQPRRERLHESAVCFSLTWPPRPQTGGSLKGRYDAHLQLLTFTNRQPSIR